MKTITTTTTNALGEAQRTALALADAHGWRIEVQASDGSRVKLRPGHPARSVVICLGGTLPPAHEEGTDR